MQLQKSKQFEQSSVREIPEDWKLTRLEDVAEIKGRVGWKGYTRTDFVEKLEGAISLGVNNITKDNRLNMEEVRYISWKKYEESPEIQVSTGDIIITQRGSIGKIAIIDKELGKATINPNILLIKKISVNNFFLYYVLTSQGIDKQVSGFTSSTTIQLLTQQQVRSLLIPMPQNTEQQKIASILSKVDECIQKTDQVIEQTQRLKEGLMQKLLTQGIGHTKFKDIHLGLRFLRLSIPENWNIASLDEITEIIDTPHYTSPYIDSGVSVVRTADCDPSGQINYSNTKFTSKTEYEKRRETIDPDVGDVLYTREAPPGIAVLVDRKKISIGQRIVLVKPNAQIINGEFLVSFLNSRFCMLQSNAMILKTTVEHVNIEPTN